jgi:NADH-quinone oxidoreductase subunit E
VALTEDTRLRAREIVARYPRPRSALLPMLHLVQADEGYVSPDGIALCAEELGLTKAEVGAVATFYTMYKRRPAGDWLVSVCTNTVCGMLGGDAIYAAVSEQLGVKHDQTTSDGTITLEHAECLAACDYAPVVTVNYEFYDNQTPETATGLVDQLRTGLRPAPTRGAPLCTFREISRQLAGFPDGRVEAVDAGPAGEPTLAGARLSVQRRETAPAYPPEHANGASGSDGRADAGAGREGAVRAQPSAHDAPLPTAVSDPNSAAAAAPAAPTTGPSTGPTTGRSKPSASRSADRRSADRKGD